MEFCISDLCIEAEEEATATKLHFERSNFRITFVERWPRKICGWKNDSVNRCAVYSITTRNSHTLLFVFTSSSSHPDRCQKTLVFFFKKPHIFPIRKDRFAALSYSSLQEEDSKKKKGQNGVGCGCQNGTKDESMGRILLTLLFITIDNKFTKGQTFSP